MYNDVEDAFILIQTHIKAEILEDRAGSEDGRQRVRVLILKCSKSKNPQIWEPRIRRGIKRYVCLPI